MQADEIVFLRKKALYNFSLIKYNAEVIQPGLPGNKKGTVIMKKIIAIALSVMLLALCCVGCGSTKDEAKETVVVGYTIYAPMNYLDENNQLIGFDTDLAKAVFEGLGYEVIFQEIDWSSKYTDLNAGTIDCIWNGFTCNVADDDDGIQRAEKVDFSYNYMENRQVIVAKADAGITSAADLSGKIAAVESGSAGESYAASFDGVTSKGFLKQTDCLFEVNAGTADFAVLDAQLAKSYAGKGDYESLAIVDDLSSDVEYYAIGFKKGSELTAKVNEQLEKLAADGTIAQIAQKYEVENTTITDFSDQK